MKRWLRNIKSLNPKLILLFPVLLIPSLVYYMVRPWLLIEDMVEKDRFLGVDLWRKEKMDLIKIENKKRDEAVERPA